jgi:hypothetical protein
VSPVADTEIAYVKQAWANDWPLDPTTLDVLNQIRRYWPDDEADQANAFVQQTQDTITLYPKPTVAYTDGLVMKLAIYPSMVATGVVDWLGERYAEDLAAGAKAILMAQKGKPWSSTEGAAEQRALFEAAKTAGVSDANKSFTRVSQRVRMSRSW